MFSTSATDFLKRLLDTPGPSGFEAPAGRVWREEAQAFAHKVTTDVAGNSLAEVNPDGFPTIMLDGHIDEIGLIVHHIDDDGYLWFTGVGGWDPVILVGQRVEVATRGGAVAGVVGKKPIHLLKKEEREKSPKIEEFFVDLMLPAEEVHRNVSIGDPITLLREPVITQRAVTAPYLDDRLGVFILLESLRRVNQTNTEIYAVVSVQEEVGLRGARTSSFGIAPDMGIALDITVAADLPGADKSQNPSSLGKGVSLGVMDASSISDPRLVNRFRELAEEHGIKHQLEVSLGGGTDAGGMQLARAGAPVITISTPVRYVHTANEMALAEDIEATIDLLAHFVSSAQDMELDW